MKNFLIHAKMRYYIAFLFVIAAIVIFVYFTRAEKKIYLYRQYPLMGTFVKIELFGEQKAVNKAADAIYSALRKVDKVCNIFNPQSELSILNATAYKHPVRCSDMLWEVLSASRRFYTISEGAFDITSKPLMNIWGFYGERKKRFVQPDKNKLSSVLSEIGLNKVIFNEKDRSVRFTISGTEFDLGGIAKGFAVDKAAEAALKYNVTQGIINLGGNIYCLPEPFSGKKYYRIGIRDPVNLKKICGYLRMSGASVATSGSYEQYVIINGKRYSHIMNPFTGMPVNNNILSVTVVTPMACDADALSTSIFIKGEELAKKVCARIPDTSVLLIKRIKNGRNKKKYITVIYGKNIFEIQSVDASILTRNSSP